ncbi:D-tagatose-bisphosphate aldolase, class II, non-catalytic subunit [Labrys monachus]|uniref:D-tagatose-1,6-bisphosphate aldolase subunit GatZ/KbaZ n=1 Tax=Labrys monachus TaxID=217067 RepID=A0ABU0FK65_9HYPH|nr:D-tagatose-bisphosphate aldolase, class II, non-catalytic subunit [Labrys monachus]MDQ0395000.1 D-tagatose-1,6-bisphosphate aldolase subunit GatZ/KbaZ [Labrys monachus]
MTILQDLVDARRRGAPRGITSVCSAHPVVIETALAHGRDLGAPVLIEATCNQVNQDGGYTGMTPADFHRFVLDRAGACGFDSGRLVLGGDHLGPNPWRHLDAAQAMDKAEAMMTAFVAAGFAKIHLDASMGCRGEPEALDDETTARRAARLTRAAEKAAREAGLPPPVYIIGTEVPTPGGALHALDGLQPTSAAAARRTIATHREIFRLEGVEEALERVIGVVVQPGVEFGHEDVVVYEPEKARELVAVLDDEPSLVFEAHSTDYQPRDRLARLVADGFVILKVGPGLTFALREALYGLDLIAGELEPGYAERSLTKAMEALMLAEPGYWQRYYHGGPAEQRVLRHYSYSDRIRYYWPHPAAIRAVEALARTLAGRALPATLVHQFLPAADNAGNGRDAPLDMAACLALAVRRVLDDYASAAAPEAGRSEAAG